MQVELNKEVTHSAARARVMLREQARGQPPVRARGQPPVRARGQLPVKAPEALQGQAQVTPLRDATSQRR